MRTNEQTQALLRQGKEIYEQLADHTAGLYKAGSHAEIVLSWIETTATFAWHFHSGRFADGELENIALEIGENLEKLVTEQALPPPTGPATPRANDSRRKILHVLTSAHNIGGHTRLVYNWIKNEHDSQHSVLLTRQGNEEVPTWLSAAVNESGGGLIVLPAGGKLARAYWLRSVARAGTDLVILHHHPNDVLPLVAFATTDNPPVAVLNHADHVFWLGASVADLVADLRADGKRVSEQRRGAKKSLLLPMPIMPDAPLPSRQEARRHLNICADQVALLSMGNAYKYKPTKTHNFFRTVTKILKRNPQAHMYLVGVEWDDSIAYLQEAKHERFHLLGVREQPRLYQVAADLYLNSFPFSSGMALLETCAAGAYPVMVFSPLSGLADLRDEAYEGLITNPQTEEEYIRRVKFLIQHEVERQQLAAQIAERIVDFHRGQTWHEYLRAIYDYLEGRRHSPARIPSSAFAETDDDLMMNAVNMMPEGPLLLTTGKLQPGNLALPEVMWLFATSLKLRDTRLAFRHFVSLLWRMEFKRLLLFSQTLGGVLSIRGAAGLLAESLKIKDRKRSYQQLYGWLELFKLSAN
jgi:hypothetical protein